MDQSRRRQTIRIVQPPRTVGLSTGFAHTPNALTGTKLSLVGLGITDIDTAPCNAANITHLYLSGNNLKNLSGIEQFTNLQSLSLNFNQLSDFKILRVFLSLPKLKHLSLQGNPISEMPLYKIKVIAFCAAIGLNLESFDGIQLSKTVQDECLQVLNLYDTALSLSCRNQWKIEQLVYVLKLWTVHEEMFNVIYGKRLLGRAVEPKLDEPITDLWRESPTTFPFMSSSDTPFPVEEVRIRLQREVEERFRQFVMDLQSQPRHVISTTLVSLPNMLPIVNESIIPPQILEEIRFWSAAIGQHCVDSSAALAELRSLIEAAHNRVAIARASAQNEQLSLSNRWKGLVNISGFQITSTENVPLSSSTSLQKLGVANSSASSDRFSSSGGRASTFRSSRSMSNLEKNENIDTQFLPIRNLSEQGQQYMVNPPTSTGTQQNTGSSQPNIPSRVSDTARNYRDPQKNTSHSEFSSGTITRTTNHPVSTSLADTKQTLSDPAAGSPFADTESIDNEKRRHSVIESSKMGKLQPREDNVSSAGSVISSSSSIEINEALANVIQSSQVKGVNHPRFPNRPIVAQSTSSTKANSSVPTRLPGMRPDASRSRHPLQGPSHMDKGNSHGIGVSSQSQIPSASSTTTPSKPSPSLPNGAAGDNNYNKERNITGNIQETSRLPPTDGETIKGVEVDSVRFDSIIRQLPVLPRHQLELVTAQLIDRLRIYQIANVRNAAVADKQLKEMGEQLGAARALQSAEQQRHEKEASDLRIEVASLRIQLQLAQRQLKFQTHLAAGDDQVDQMKEGGIAEGRQADASTVEMRGEGGALNEVASEKKRTDENNRSTILKKSTVVQTDPMTRDTATSPILLPPTHSTSIIHNEDSGKGNLASNLNVSRTNGSDSFSTFGLSSREDSLRAVKDDFDGPVEPHRATDQLAPHRYTENAESSELEALKAVVSTTLDRSRRRRLFRRWGKAAQIRTKGRYLSARVAASIAQKVLRHMKLAISSNESVVPEKSPASGTAKMGQHDKKHFDGNIDTDEDEDEGKARMGENVTIGDDIIESESEYEKAEREEQKERFRSILEKINNEDKHSSTEQRNPALIDATITQDVFNPSVDQTSIQLESLIAELRATVNSERTQFSSFLQGMQTVLNTMKPPVIHIGSSSVSAAQNDLSAEQNRFSLSEENIRLTNSPPGNTTGVGGRGEDKQSDCTSSHNGSNKHSAAGKQFDSTNVTLPTWSSQRVGLNLSNEAVSGVGSSQEETRAPPKQNRTAMDILNAGSTSLPANLEQTLLYHHNSKSITQGDRTTGRPKISAAGSEAMNSSINLKKQITSNGSQLIPRKTSMSYKRRSSSISPSSSSSNSSGDIKRLHQVAASLSASTLDENGALDEISYLSTREHLLRSLTPPSAESESNDSEFSPLKVNITRT